MWPGQKGRKIWHVVITSDQDSEWKFITFFSFVVDSCMDVNGVEAVVGIECQVTKLHGIHFQAG